jgi:sporulation protein YlmC with PRC-barrel domain
MLVHASELENFPVLSLQVGGEIARCKQAIIDPGELSVTAYTLNVFSIDEDIGGNILSVEDVREFSPNGLIIDSGSRFVSRSDVVKLDKIMGLGFNLINLKVVSESGKKIGKIKDYTIDTKTFMIYQIIVDRPVLKSFIDPELTINRSQISEIDDYKVVVKNDTEKISINNEEEEFKPDFVNPFRKEPKLQEQKESDE